MQGAFVLALFLLAVNVQGWDYTNPSWWYQSYPACGGNRQSPINIASSSAVKNTTVPPLRFTGSCGLGGVQKIDRIISHDSIKLTFQYTAGQTKCSLIDPKTGKTYELLQVHFHRKSEHTFDGSYYDSVLHWVFADPATLNDSEITLSVVGTPLTTNASLAGGFVNPKDEEALVSVLLSGNLPQTDNVTVSQTKFNRGLYFAEVMPINKTFWTYPGSLTTPPCWETVQWYLFTQPGYMPAAAYQKYIAALTASNPDFPRYGNVRPTQWMRGRVVEIVPDFSNPAPAPEGIKEPNHALTWTVAGILIGIVSVAGAFGYKWASGKKHVINVKDERGDYVPMNV